MLSRDLTASISSDADEVPQPTLHEFVIGAWHVLEPGRQFIDSWHIVPSETDQPATLAEPSRAFSAATGLGLGRLVAPAALGRLEVLRSLKRDAARLLAFLPCPTELLLALRLTRSSHGVSLVS